MKFCENPSRSMKYALAPVDITEIRALLSAPGGGRSVSGAFYVYCETNRVGLGCPEAMQDTQLDNLVRNISARRKSERCTLQVSRRILGRLG